MHFTSFLMIVEADFGSTTTTVISPRFSRDLLVSLGKANGQSVASTQNLNHCARFSHFQSPFLFTSIISELPASPIQYISNKMLSFFINISKKYS